MRYHLGPGPKLDGSGTREQLLCQDGKIFVMDNHRLAAWCWLHTWDGITPISIVHLDWHWDLAGANSPADSSNIAALTIGCSLEGFRQSQVKYDDYLSYFLHYYHDKIVCMFFSVAQEDELKCLSNELCDRNICILPRQLLSLLKTRTQWSLPGPTVINLDLDFFTKQAEEDPEAQAFATTEEAYECAALVGVWIKSIVDDPNCIVVTIALSPSFLDTPSDAEGLLSVIFNALGRQVPTVISTGEHHRP